MAEPKSKGQQALSHALIGVLTAIAAWLGRDAISPARAQTPSGVATYEQVEKLDRKFDALSGRVLAVELEQAKLQGAQSAAAQNAVHRGQR